MTKRLSVQEAAEVLGVGARTIRRYLSEGRLTAHRLGPKLIRIDAAELERLHTPIGGI
jgi:excisionase family DNA binding protein